MVSLEEAFWGLGIWGSTSRARSVRPMRNRVYSRRSPLKGVLVETQALFCKALGFATKPSFLYQNRTSCAYEYLSFLSIIINVRVRGRVWRTLKNFKKIVQFPVDSPEKKHKIWRCHHESGGWCGPQKFAKTLHREFPKRIQKKMKKSCWQKSATSVN